MMITESHIYTTQANRVQAAIVKARTAPTPFLQYMQNQVAREEFAKLRVLRMGHLNAHLN